MHPVATNRLLIQHITQIERRVTECGWRIKVHGTVVLVEMTHRPSGELYRLAIVADEYPLVPVAVHFLPVPPRTAEAKWPYDGNFVFRTQVPRPFVCIGGVRSFVPEDSEPQAPLGFDEIHVGSVLTNFDRAIHGPRYQGPVYLQLH